MAELRTTENELANIVKEYKSLRRRIPLVASKLDSGSATDECIVDLPSLKDVVVQLYPPSTSENTSRNAATKTEKNETKANNDDASSGEVASDVHSTVREKTTNDSVNTSTTDSDDGKTKKARKHISWGDTPTVATRETHEDDEQNRSGSGKEKKKDPPPPPSAPMTALERAFLKQAQKWGNSSSSSNTSADGNSNNNTTARNAIESGSNNEEDEAEKPNSKKKTTKISFVDEGNAEQKQTKNDLNDQTNSSSNVLDSIDDEVDENDEDFSSLSQLEQMKAVMESLNQIDQTLQSLQPKMEKYNQRLLIVDPVTGHSRYGSGTRKRVIVLTQTFGALQHVLLAGAHASKLSMFKDRMMRQIQNDEHQIKEEEQHRLEQENAARMEMERKQKEEEEERRRIERERLQQEEAERQELAQRAEEARRQRDEQQRLEEEAYRSQRNEEQAYMNGISKNEDGMKQQLIILKESCSSSSSGGAYMNAITALHTLMTQIVSYPEEVKFRRIRRNHEQFQNDIGQYKGGEGFLIAAGFRYTRMIMSEDNPVEVDALVSTEPNLETQMDEWSEWFDRNKKAIEVLEDAMINT